MKRSYLIIGFLAILILFSCREDSLENEEITPMPPVGNIPELVELNLRGRVVDLEGLAIENATVSVGTNSLTTDVNGFYNAGKILAPSNGLYIKAEKEGYFVGGQQYNPNFIDDEVSVVVTLSRYELTSTFNSAGEISLDLPDGSSLLIPQNSISLNGTQYNGDVIINMKWLDPTLAETRLLMPGELLGVRTNGERQLLQSYGMIGVEMFDPSGNLLQISEGQQAELSFPIPNDLQGTAPAEIPLWFFDEDTGVWIEEGSAAKSGNIYIGMVDHFTWWNCDIPGDYTYLCLNFSDMNGYSVNYGSYCLNSPSLGASIGLLDSHEECGLVPRGEELTIEMKDECGQVYDVINIGPYSTDLEIENVVVNNTPDVMTVFGSATTCDGSPVEFGFVELETSFGTFSDLYVSNGNYSIPFSVCNLSATEVILTAYDLDNFEESGPKVIELDYGQPTFEYDVAACGEVIEGQLIINTDTGISLTNDDCKARVTPDELLITAFANDLNPEGEYRILIGVQGYSEGVFEANLILFYEPAFAYIQLEGVADNFEVEILKYGDVGQQIVGKFNHQGQVIGTFTAERTH